MNKSISIEPTKKTQSTVTAHTLTSHNCSHSQAQSKRQSHVTVVPSLRPVLSLLVTKREVCFRQTYVDSIAVTLRTESNILNT